MKWPFQNRTKTGQKPDTGVDALPAIPPPTGREAVDSVKTGQKPDPKPDTGPDTGADNTREVMLDDESLDRAIRAGVQFPLDWFLGQPPEVQEAIAARRDMWLEDLTVAAGYAILDPERTRLALAAEDGDDDAEVELLGLNAVEIAKEMGLHAASRAPQATSAHNPLSMSGVGERRQAAEDEREAGRRKSSFFGAEEKTA